MRTPRSTAICILLLCAILLSVAASVTRTAHAQSSADNSGSGGAQSLTFSGILGVVWYDAEIPVETSPHFYLFAPTGDTYRLEIPEQVRAQLGDTYSLNNQAAAISALPEIQALEQNAPPILNVTSLTLQASTAEVTSAAVTGSKPWLNLLCKFNDIPTEPQSISYFQNLFGADFGELNHYWQTSSYGAIDINGSQVVSHWYNLPSNRSAYFSGSFANLQKLAEDCTAIADPDIDFSSYFGVNLIFNSDLDGFAWGGSWYLSLDGPARAVPMTWLPPWGYQNQSPLAHEMGHAFGLPHSSGPYGATYDSEWDVMSNPWECLLRTAYGCISTDTISYHKNLLGWIPAERRYIAALGTSRLVTIERLTEIPSNPDSFLMAKAVIPGTSKFYTIEVRDNITDVSNGYFDLEEYEDNIPSNNYARSSIPNQPVVLIHEVDPNRSNTAQVVDKTLNGDPNDEGAMWRPGETFNGAGNIAITVVQATGNGYLVRIRNGTTLNNSISKPLLIQPVPFVFHQNITGMDTSPNDPLLPCAGNIQGEGTVWYQFKPVNAGITTVDTRTSRFDTVLAVWSGTPDSLTLIACDDDGGEAGTSSLVFGANAGTSYYIEVAGKFGTGDYLSFHLAMNPCFTATTRTSPSSAGVVSLETAPNCMGNKFLNGSSLTYSVTSNSGYLFKSWSGNGSGANNPLTIPIFSNQVVTANFVPTASPIVLLSPAHNSLTRNYIPTFKWKAAVLAAGTFFDHFQFQLATDKDFTSIVADENVFSNVAPEFTVSSELLPNTTYFWKVRVFNTLGNVSLWSPRWILRTALLPPILTAPSDGYDSPELRPTLDWDDVATATDYVVQISRNPGFTQILQTSNPKKSVSVPTVNLPRNTTLYWRVRVNGANGPSAFSGYRSFVTPVNPPAAPSLLLPAVNTLVRDYRPAFTWKPVSNAQSYIIQVDNNSNFSSPEINDGSPITPTFTPATELSSNIKYYWRVRAVNSTGELSNWSAVRYFRTAILPPGLLTPTDDSTAVLRRPPLDWENVPGNTGYILQVWKAGTTPVLVKTVTLTKNVSQYQFITNLLPNTAYYWKVQTVAVNGPSLWSDPFDFVTGP